MTNGLNLLCPVVDGERLRPALQSIRQQEGLLELVFSGGGLTELVLTLDGRGEALLLSSSFLTSGTELNALEILPSGSMVNFYDLINFRNHHGTPSTWPELPLADKVDTTTFSSDWQFAPHPSMLLFRKNETVVLAAPLDLPKAFGFRFRCTRYLLEQWDLDYGPRWPRGAADSRSAVELPCLCPSKRGTACGRPGLRRQRLWGHRPVLPAADPGRLHP